jgi:homoserine acetyltransferase
MPGGGGSSRASTDPEFPALYSIGDLSAASALLLEDLGAGAVRAFCGASMAGLIGLDLAYRRPDLVRGLALWVTSYRSDGFARALAESLVGILKLDGGGRLFSRARREEDDRGYEPSSARSAVE